MKGLFVSVLAVIFMVVLACSQDRLIQGEKLEQAKCVRCHNNLVICAKLGADKTYWSKTVGWMSKKGLGLSKDDQELIVDFLVAQEPGSRPVCN